MTAKPISGPSPQYYQYTQGRLWKNCISRANSRVMFRWIDILIWRLMLWPTQKEDEHGLSDHGKWRLEVLRSDGSEVWRLTQKRLTQARIYKWLHREQK